MKRRLPKLPSWLAGIYLAWSLLVFFGSLGSESHSWWPTFLYPIIWPLSFGIQKLDFVSSDVGYAVFYILAGTIWIWAIARLFSAVVTRLFPFKDEKIVA